MTVGISHGAIRIVDGKISRGSLPVGKIIGPSHNIEVAHLMDERPGFGIRARQRSRPECAAQIDIVRLIRIHISIHIRLCACAIEENTGVIHRIGDGGEIAFDRVVSGGTKHTKPRGIARALDVRQQIILCIGGINLRFIAG